MTFSLSETRMHLHTGVSKAALISDLSRQNVTVYLSLIFNNRIAMSEVEACRACGAPPLPQTYPGFTPGSIIPPLRGCTCTVAAVDFCHFGTTIDSSLPPRVLFRGRNALLHRQPGFREQHGHVLLSVYVYSRAAGAEQFFLKILRFNHQGRSKRAAFWFFRLLTGHRLLGTGNGKRKACQS
jgi:hypothetical protein